MFTGRVIGTVDATISHPAYKARRLLVVEKTDGQGQPAGGYVIALDTVDAGVGDPVLVLDEGTGARQVLGEPQAPVRSVIVGIVDATHIPET